MRQPGPDRLILTLVVGLVLAIASARPAVAQAIRVPATGNDSMIVYRREVFEYSRAGRPDPFRSLLGTADIGVRVEDLALRGVVLHADPARSVAILSRSGATRLIRAHVGDRIGGIRIMAIRQRSIEVLVEELGVARRETLQITRAPAPKG